MTDESPRDDGSAVTEVDYVVLPAGRKIGRFEVVSVLGQGSFGITYRARDRQLGRDVAIKEYMPAALAVRRDGATVRPRSTATADDFRWGRDRFVEEGRTIATLHDAPGVVRVFEFLEANGTAYIVMELVRGETLDARLRRDGMLDAAAVERILGPLLNGLEQVHAAGFLHRDIKPGNILLDGRGNPTLIDFGASRAAMANRTVAMTAIFTPGYAAVEQFTSAKQGPWTDIYGVSATLYHAIAGKAPPSAIDRMLDDTCVPLGRLAAAGFPAGLLAGIDAGLAVRAAERPQSIAAWRGVLGGSDATVALPRPARAAMRNRRLLWIGAAAAAVQLLAGGGYVVFVSGRPAAPAATAATDVADDRQRVEEDARRHASALADQQRRQAESDEARRKADAEAAEAREALAAVQAAREQAEAETARQQAEAVRLKSEAEAAARREAEAEAEAKAKAAADAVARQQAEAEAAAKQKADAEEAARQKAEDDQRKTAEAAETALRLAQVDRQRIQVALTSLGFDTRSNDGTFGRRSREMIAAWQQKSGAPATGFVSAAQRDQLLRSAAPAVTRWEEQKKIEEEKKKAEEKARTAAEAAAATDPARLKKQTDDALDGLIARSPAPGPTPNRSAAPPPPAGSVAGLANGTYRGGMSVATGSVSVVAQVTVRAAGGRASGTLMHPRCGSYSYPINLAVDPAGAVTGSLQLPPGLECSGAADANVTGRVEGGRLVLEMSGRSTPIRGRMTLTRTGD